MLADPACEDALLSHAMGVVVLCKIKVSHPG
jgi:hypothetical protein